MKSTRRSPGVIELLGNAGWLRGLALHLAGREDLAADVDEIDIGAVKLVRAKQQASRPTAETGLRVAHEGGQAVVTGIYENSPASRAGIRVRDRVLAVDGHPVADLGGRAIGRILAGEDGTSVKVRVQTGSDAPRDVGLERAHF